MKKATEKAVKIAADNKEAIYIRRVISLLRTHYPDAHCALHFSQPFELLVATVLSAQCTDERVNQVTPLLFQRFPGPYEMSKASIKEIEALIHSTGFFRNKAKSLKEASQVLVSEFKGQVPKTLDKLVSLRGVGRKTAHVVLGNAFGIASGVVVDTHVGRLSQRLAWTQETTPEKIEQDLERKIPKKYWILISHLLIEHGRKLCKARKPSCKSCFLFDLCPKAKV